MLSKLDKSIIRRLQEDIPLDKSPFKIMAEEVGITEKELLDKIHDLQDKKIMRRFGAVLHHRKAGFSSNVMVVWVVPDDKCEEAGKVMASFPQVSHCYKRTPLVQWPYNMYTMIHGQTKEECETVVSDISKKTGINEYELLYSTKELKKTSMKYFAE